MSEPQFFQHPSGVEIAITEKPDGGYVVSAFDPKSGRALLGSEATNEGVLSWCEGARLVFAKPEGSA